MKFITAILALFIVLAGTTLAADQVTEKLKTEIHSIAPAFEPRVTLTESRMQVTLAKTMTGQYPSAADLHHILQYFQWFGEKTGYVGQLTLIIENGDGIAEARYDIAAGAPVFGYNQADQTKFFQDGYMKLPAGREGIGGSAEWLYKDPNFVGV